MKGLSLPKRITLQILHQLYIVEKQSVAQIAAQCGCSQNKINYWLKKFGIQKRSISDAVYALKNPLGDPFIFRKPKNVSEGMLYGLGLALYWGEGTKRGKGAVRLSNSDPKLIRIFMEFLEVFFGVDRNKMKFTLQIFKDILPEKALSYWIHELDVKEVQFYKPTRLKVRGKGSYKYKSTHGVVILYFNNIKLKRLICKMIDNIH